MKHALAGLAAALGLVSCVPSTPQARIERSPQMFDSLPAKHQELVRQGQITRGMSPDAVYLAWGRPAETFQGSRDGRVTERWDYAGSRPVFTPSFYGSYGYGWGPYGGCGRHAYYGFGPEVVYIPYRVASVWFLDRRVDSWERAR